MKTASPTNGIDIHALTPSASSATMTQTDLTSSLRRASRAVPDAWVASNALRYACPCLLRMPKAFPPNHRMTTPEKGAKSGGNVLTQKHSAIGHDTSGSAFHAASI